MTRVVRDGRVDRTALEESPRDAGNEEICRRSIRRSPVVGTRDPFSGRSAVKQGFLSSSTDGSREVDEDIALGFGTRPAPQERTPVLPRG